MVHTYEVLVDIQEGFNQLDNIFRRGTARYEIDAESKQTANGMALMQARGDYPNGVEFDARVTRFLK